MNVKERIAYVRGLIEGSEFYGKDGQAKAIWESLLRICDDLADSVEELEAGLEETDEYVEAIDSDLADLESDVYEYDDDDDEEDEDDEDEAEEGNMVEMECPNCGEEVFFEEEFLYDSDVEISCPECGGVVYATGEATDAGAAQEPVPVRTGSGSDNPSDSTP